MERLINVSVFKLFIQWPSEVYIIQARRFNVNCTVVSSKLGFLKDKYCLNLKGTEEEIEKFIDYLKFEDFKIE